MIVYGLVDPRNKELRYVGQTMRTADARLRQHLQTAKNKSTPPVNAWLRALAIGGLLPDCIELDDCNSHDAMNEAEIFWIAYMRAMGANLLNISAGGSTRAGYRHSAATRAKWSRERRGERGSNFGNRWTEEQRVAGSKATREWIKKNGHPLKGRKMSESFCKHVSDGRKGIVAKLSAEGRKAKAEATARRWDNPDYREQMTRPGLANPNAKPVVVDGVAYGHAELARKLGVGRSTVARRVAEFPGRALTSADFRNRRAAEIDLCLHGAMQ